MADTELAEILDDLSAYYGRFMTFQHPEAESDAIALWSYLTHCFDAFDQVAYLGVSSPARECGKSRLLELLESTCANAENMIRPSEASFFRAIHEDRPTVLLDEVDTIFGSKGDYEGLRAALNAGIKRTASVRRCVGGGSAGGEIKSERFSVFCPKVLAGIGEFPDTVASRCISIRLHRRRIKSEKPVERVRTSEFVKIGKALHDRMVRHAAATRWDGWDVWTDFPGVLGDRAMDYWEPLFVIADRAGPGWVKRCREAAITTETARDSEREMPLNIRLLGDIRTIVSIGRVHPPSPEDFITSHALVAKLHALEEAPWGDMRRGLGLSTKALASFMRDFGIRPSHSPERDSRGYYLADIWRVAERYLPMSG